jgi:hypothetical protein
MVFTFGYLALATVSAFGLSRRYAPASDSFVTSIAGVTIFTSLLIIPLQLAAALELLRVLPALSFPLALAIQAAMFVLTVAVCARHNCWMFRFAHGRQLFALPLHLQIGVGLITAAFAVKLLDVILGFPHGWDAVAYHYPLAVRWLQDASLRIDARTDWRFSFPSNVEMITLIVLKSGAQRLIGCVQWPAVIGLVFAAAYLPRRLFRAPAGTVPVIVTLLSIPIVYYQAFEGYVDLFGAAFLFCAVALALAADDARKARESSRETPIFLALASGLACGLAVGAKPVFWAYGLVAVLGWVLWSLQSTARNRQRLRDAPWIATGILLTCGFWFGRALGETGNPFYPLQLRVGEKVLLHGVPPSAITAEDAGLEFVRRTTEWVVYPWTEWKRHPGSWLLNYAENSGLGAAFATFVVTGILYFVWITFRKGSHARLQGSMWLAALAVLTVLWWFAFRREPRFALPVVILMCLMSTPFFDVLERAGTRVYRIVFIGSVAATVCLLVRSPLFDIAATISMARWTRAAYYSYPPSIDRLPPGVRLLNCAGETFEFPLAGKTLSNQVVSWFEVPSRLSPEFLDRKKVDFVVERTENPVESAANAAPPESHLRLAERQEMHFGQQTVVWRIWKAAPEKRH